MSDPFDPGPAPDARQHPKYGAWIMTEYPTREDAHHHCQSASRKMVEAFPELLRVRGWYGGTEHWWCKTIDGEIVDPTAHQFRYAAEYREFIEGVDVEPIGQCMNCGDYVWDRDPETREPIAVVANEACSESCLRALKAYYRY